jgi:hypothetical protein
VRGEAVDESATPRPTRSLLTPTVAAVGGIAIVGFLLRLAILARSIAVIDRLFVPDDTYYTLTIARSIAHGHGPTVDGHTLTSGFQPLLGFLMVPVYWLTDNPDTALRADLALLVLFDTATIVVLAWIAYRLAGRVAGIAAAALWALSPVAVSMALGGLETSLAMFFAVALVATWMWANDAPGTLRWVALGVMGALAVFARVDLLLLVALLAALQLWKGPRRALFPASIAGLVTLAPWWIWCTVEFGSPIPTSGSVAHDMAPLRPFSRHGLAQVAGAVAGGPFDVWRGLRGWLDAHPLVGVCVFTIFVVGLLMVAWRWFHRFDGPALGAAALPMFAAGLLVFYAWFGVGWYFTRYLAPVALVVSLILAVVVAQAFRLEGSRRRTALAVLGALAVVPVIAAVHANWHGLRATTARASVFDSVTGYRDAALVVATTPPKGSVVGAWQSGAFGYYANGRVTVVNLDGVVNPDAARAARNDRTAFYIRDRGIDWLADFEPHLLWFAFGGAKQLDPSPTITGVTGLPQFPPFPDYGIARINW